MHSGNGSPGAGELPLVATSAPTADLEKTAAVARFQLCRSHERSPTLRLPLNPATKLLFVLFGLAGLVGQLIAEPLLPPRQWGNLLQMTNANVRLEYDLSTGRANFYWQNG